CFATRLRPPTSTLLPYTTLFRSRHRSRSRCRRDLRNRSLRSLHDRRRRGSAHPLAPAGRRARPDLGGLGGGSPCGIAPPNVSASDRKSTRLNSSHVKTSYAVFCL